MGPARDPERYDLSYRLREPRPRYSVVVPVYNEGANIGAWCRQARSLLPPLGETLIVYDLEEDDTLPALREIGPDERPDSLRPVRNALGRGVRWAIEAGMRASRGPVVLVSMADLSDDLRKAGEMVTRAEAGASVVCASRYMPGGTQHGGPRIKGALSRLAGRSLHSIAGLPTRDPTNSFKAYRSDFLAATPIESTVGFCLGLELTVKAHFKGLRVEEVPANWWHRSTGESRFRLLAWLPHYLRWYFWALGQRLLGRPHRSAQVRGKGQERPLP